MNNPISLDVFAAVINEPGVGCGLPPDGLVLDVGCGRGELLGMLLAASACRGLGVDTNAALIAAARTELAAFGARVELLAVAALDMPALGEPLCGAICVGSSHAFAAPPDSFGATLDALAPMVRSGGWLMMGELFWRTSPAAEYLAATGLQAGELMTQPELLALAEQRGLRLVSTNVAGASDWDAFEGAHLERVELAAQDAPDDPDAQAKAQRVRAWHDAYRRWGRDTLGFGLFVFEV